MAETLNNQLAKQSDASPLDALDRCDRCGAAAAAQFVYTVGEVMVCGYHLRQHLAALLVAQPQRMWIEPTVLWFVKGVKVPKQNHSRAGDGLTDASR